MTWGEAELERWFLGLNDKHRGTVAFYVDLLTARGPLLGDPYTRQLHGKLRELRFHLEPGRSGSLTGSPRGAGSSC
ncbi:type II toxin-antitoxin system RelE/ParE family toxin [Streptomyces sp. NPDC004044]